MKKAYKATTNWIKDQDEIVQPSSSELHFQTDFKQKTMIGGLCSLAVTFYVLWMVYSQGRKLVELDNNSYVSLQQQMNYEAVGKQKIGDMSKPLIEFLEGGDNTITLTSEDNKYINIRLVNIIKSFDAAGVLKVEPKGYKLTQCVESDFQRNEFDKKYWEYVKGNRAQYCVVDPNNEIYMQGTRDSLLLKQDHAYIYYEVTKCNDALKEADTVCASVTDINAWIENKIVAMKLLNQKIDFYEFDDAAIRYNEVFIPGIPMNKYSDTGYRFRYNEFNRQDGPYLKNEVKDTFFDFQFYNSDTFPTPPNSPESAQYLIAEMYFRLEVDQVSHARNVYTMMDFIGALGGVSDLLLQILGWIFGGYAAFYSGVATLSALYRVKENGTSIFLPSKQNKAVDPDLAKIKVSQSTRVFLFFLQGPLGCLCGPCKKPVHDQYLKVLEAGGERKEEEFDIALIVTTLRDLRFEVDVLRDKTNTKDDPDFKRNPRDLLDLAELGEKEEEGKLNDTKNDNEKQSNDTNHLAGAKVGLGGADLAPQLQGNIKLNAVNPEIKE